MVSRNLILSLIAGFGLMFLGRPVFAADTLVFGVPEFDAGLRLLDENHPAALLVRSAATRGLTVRTGPTEIGLGVADTMKSSPDFTLFSFRISSAARFSNQQSVIADDVVYSLRRCQSAGRLTQLAGASTKQPSKLPELQEEWVELSLKPQLTLEERAVGFLVALADCPVVSRQVAETFGRYFGVGTNLVSTGGYGITDFNAGKEYYLQRLDLKASGQRGPPNIQIRGFRDSSHALTALRSGTIDVLYTEDAIALSRASKDVTLSAVRCGSYTVIHRKNLTFPCEPVVIVEGIKYLG